MNTLASHKEHDSDNTVFIVAVKGRIKNVLVDLVATFVRQFGRNVKLIFLCQELSWSQLFGLVPFHRIIISWNYLATGKNSFNMIADLALNPDYNRYKMAEYFAPNTKFTESCFTNKHTNNATTNTTESTILYVWLIHTHHYFPHPEITPLIQLLILLRRKLRDVGSRLEIVTHIRNNNLKLAFEGLGFVCHTERMRSYYYGFSGYDYRDLFDTLIPKYNELDNKKADKMTSTSKDNFANNNTDQKSLIPRNKTKLHLNINRFGTPRSIMKHFAHQFVSIRYNLQDNRDFWKNGHQLLVPPLDLVTDQTIEILMKMLDDKACAL